MSTARSERYTSEVSALADWLAERLPALGPLRVTSAEFLVGTDSLADPHAALCDEAFRHWLDIRKYELSYNQMCNAFFAAARDAGVLEVSDP
jgi:hypothetical protein